LSFKYTKTEYVTNNRKFNMKKTLLQRIIIGVKLGFNEPNLPKNILKFHLHPIIRILRVISWITTISYLSGRLQSFPTFILYIAIIIIAINFIYFIYIGIMQLKHIIKVLKSEAFDKVVRNYPLDKNK